MALRQNSRIGVLGFAVVVAIGWLWIREGRPLLNRWAVRDALRPVRLSNCTQKRVGAPGDGGYVMCVNLFDQAKSAYSYGVDARDDWGCQISKQLGVTVHEYDCFNTKRPVCEGGQLEFHEECVGPKAEQVDGRPFDSPTHQIQRNGDRGKNLIVKMDVEAAEWDTLLATPDEVLDRIDQLSIEFHGANEERNLRVIEKLKRSFHVVDVHLNNYWCSFVHWPMPAWAYEVLFVNRRIGVLADGGAIEPNPHHAPNVPEGADCQIRWD